MTVLCVWAISAAIGVQVVEVLLWLRHQRKMKAILRQLNELQKR